MTKIMYQVVRREYWDDYCYHGNVYETKEAAEMAAQSSEDQDYFWHIEQIKVIFEEKGSAING